MFKRHTKENYQSLIDKKNEVINDLKEKNKELIKMNESKKDEITRLENSVATLNTIVKSFDGYKIRRHELPLDIYHYIVSHRLNKERAFSSDKGLNLGAGEYILLTAEDEKYTQLAKVKKISTMSIDSSFFEYEALGFNSQTICDMFIKMQYPEASEETTIYVYYVDIIK